MPVSQSFLLTLLSLGTICNLKKKKHEEAGMKTTEELPYSLPGIGYFPASYSSLLFNISFLLKATKLSIISCMKIVSPITNETIF